MSVPEKILVVQPSWVGDAVMATPTLRAIRQLYPQSHISYLLRRYVKPIYTGLPFADRLITYRPGKTGLFELSARLRSARFDLAILLPNSFKTALICKMSAIPRVVGYERDARSFLLTDKLLPVKEKGRFVPVPILKTYLGIAHYLGAKESDLRMELAVTAIERAEANDALQRAGLDPETSGNAPMVLLNPGAQYGAAKCWPGERFGAVANKLHEQTGATILVSGTQKERRILDEVCGATKVPHIDLSKLKISLGALKEIIRRCDLMITNDTGPRHIAAAFGVPVVTIFGPTHPEWTEIWFEKERKIAIPVFCGPCQKKICPLDHRCMTGISPEMVLREATELLALKV